MTAPGDPVGPVSRSLRGAVHAFHRFPRCPFRVRDALSNVNFYIFCVRGNDLSHDEQESKQVCTDNHKTMLLQFNQRCHPNEMRLACLLEATILNGKFREEDILAPRIPRSQQTSHNSKGRVSWHPALLWFRKIRHLN